MIPGKGMFVVRFLAVFALIILLGWMTEAPSRYARALHATAAVVSPVVSGWWLEPRTGKDGPELWLRRGDQELKLLLSLDALALGILPLLALLSATPGLGWRRWAIDSAVGCGALFLLDLLIIVLYPWMVNNPNALTDIIGTFLGLLTFVGGPVILWFALTFDQLRPVWRLDGRTGGRVPGVGDRVPEAGRRKAR